MDKREVGKKSTNMERACFNKALTQLQNKGADIGEVVTDGHLGIAADMSKTCLIFFYLELVLCLISIQLGYLGPSMA